MKKLLPLFYFFALILIGCCTGPHYPSNYHYHSSPDPHARTLYVDVSIDKDFTDQQRFVIEEALGVWNQCLNHYFEYRMVNDRIEITQDAVDRARMDKGLIFIQLENADPSTGTLARVDDIGGSVIYVYTNRNSINLTVIEHEISHSLGLYHNDTKQSLLYPYYTEQSNGQCIDAETINQLVKVKYWMKKRYLNYCEIN